MIKNLIAFVPALFFGLTLIFWNASDTKLRNENIHIQHVLDSVISADQDEIININMEKVRYKVILVNVFDIDSNVYYKAIQNVE
jgi:hypothetical protein